MPHLVCRADAGQQGAKQLQLGSGNSQAECLGLREHLCGTQHLRQASKVLPGYFNSTSWSHADHFPGSWGMSKHKLSCADSTPAPADEAALHLARQAAQLFQRLGRPREAAEALQALLGRQAGQRAKGRGPRPRGPGWRLCCSGSCAGAPAPPLHRLHLCTMCVQEIWVLRSVRLVAVRCSGSRGTRAVGGQASRDTGSRHVILYRGGACQPLQSKRHPAGSMQP